ncbi:hypothetical protein [Neptunomonas japonica]|uniref:Uncharacterized protein n=1 Tax=Neptunomonas japonica JAMM 1380 TaxID=1441457 RepID=A0A7R6PB37_9GAMM|nr:hypothetical protein [Neptunomonas japonica]BBB30513.1 conserved hypothetical protein [Neptunomonas japonica JAMM 1380]
MMQQDIKRIQDFWQQLELTIDQLLSSRQDNQFDADGLLSDYRDTLQKIDENLTFHFERDEDDGPVEMIFGCDGYPESIHSVLSLVGAAPDLSGIRFTAFNHRYDPIPNYINVADEVCELSDYWYSLHTIENKLHLSIYMHDVSYMLDIDPRVEAVMIFLDALIGEYELMTRVWSLDWLELPTDPVDFHLKPLSELREGFDQLKHAATPIGITVH